MSEKVTTENLIAEISVEEKLLALYELQKLDSKIDEIQRLRGELPLEVQDLEDEIIGLETRLKNHKQEVTKLEGDIKVCKVKIKDAEALLKKYETQQVKVRNNREFDSLTKEIEYQNLEVKINDKRIKEHSEDLRLKLEAYEKVHKFIEEKKADLAHCKNELTTIVDETQHEEAELKKYSDEVAQRIEERLVNAYKRIKSGARNGLVVVPINRDACGGCYNKIPPQRQLDIKTHKKVIVCEYCGRILIDDEIVANVNTIFENNKYFKK